MIGSLAGDRGTLVKWEMLDGIDSPPVRELQLMCGHYYLFDIDPSLSGWYEARRKIGMEHDKRLIPCVRFHYVGFQVLVGA